MSIREIAVHLPTLAPWSPHAGYAVRLAARWGARLTGVHLLDRPEAGLAHHPQVLAKLTEQRGRMLAEAQQADAQFRAFAAVLGSSETAWCVAEGALTDGLVLAAAGADLVVLGLDPREDPLRFEPIDRAVVESRFSCLLVPPQAATSSPTFSRIVVAWNGSPESWRAMMSAAPLLERAASILLLDGSHRRREGPAEVWPPPQAMQWLDRRRIHAERRLLEADDQEAGAALLRAASDFQADLLVMGAYGRSRFSEWLLGGATRHAMRHAGLPLLVRH
jgi:nucleotide-binding universal stress UspA family protein